MPVYHVLVVLLQGFWQKEENLHEIKMPGEDDDVHDQPSDHYSKARRDEALANKKVVDANTCKVEKGLM